MSQPVRPRQTRKIQLRHPRDSCLPGLHEPGARWGQKGQNLGCRRAQWGGDCTTPDWMIDGSRRSNQGFSASTVCLNGLAEGISVCLAQQGRHLDCTFLLDEGEGEGLGWMAQSASSKLLALAAKKSLITIATGVSNVIGAHVRSFALFFLSKQLSLVPRGAETAVDSPCLMSGLTGNVFTQGASEEPLDWENMPLLAAPPSRN